MVSSVHICLSSLTLHSIPCPPLSEYSRPVWGPFPIPSPSSGITTLLTSVSAEAFKSKLNSSSHLCYFRFCACYLYPSGGSVSVSMNSPLVPNLGCLTPLRVAKASWGSCEAFLIVKCIRKHFKDIQWDRISFIYVKKSLLK